MKKKNLRKKLHEIKHQHVIALMAMAVVLATSLSATTRISALYILTGVDDTAIILDGTTSVPNRSSQIFYLASSARGYDVTLRPGLTVTVRQNDTVLTAESEEETISQLLDRLGVVPSPLEMVAVDLSDSDVEITVAEDIVYYDEIVETTHYETIRIPNSDLPQGTERVVQAGVPGLRTSIYEMVWSHGKQVSRQFVEELSTTVVDEIVEYGTAVSSVSRDDTLLEVRKNADGSGTLVFASGATMDFSAAKSMTATAYTGGHAGVGYITASGTHVKVGTVAVDKSVIPLGTRMYIITDSGIVYGMGLAEDTGVRGNKVDLYHETYEQCINFGRRPCTVYILE